METKKARGILASDGMRRFLKNRLSILGTAILLLFVFSALFADLIAPYPYDEQNLEAVYQSPSLAHPFGTDAVGRDQLSRVIHGGRASLSIGFASMGIALVFGIVLGCVAGFYGGGYDSAVMRMMDMMMAIPSVLLAIVITSALGPSLFNLTLAMGISSIPSYARITRASIMSIRGSEYIEAARLGGCSDVRIIARHVLPNILAPLIVQATLSLGLAILNASGLSFLGLGVQPPTPEWGSMLAAARGEIRNYPYLLVFPGCAIALVVLALNMVGDGLRDALDPRMKS